MLSEENFSLYPVLCLMHLVESYKTFLQFFWKLGYIFKINSANVLPFCFMTTNIFVNKL